MEFHLPISFLRVREFFFVSDDGAHGQELWMTDGTDAGTVLLDLTPGSASSTVTGKFVAKNNLVYFEANGKLWRVNTTTGKYNSLTDYASKSNLFITGNSLVYLKADPLVGTEPFFVSIEESALTQEILSPLNNSTIVYDENQKVKIVTSPSDAVDGDLDALQKTISIYELPSNTLVKTVTLPNAEPFYMMNTDWKGRTSYLIKATLTDGNQTVSALPITITTPNTLPAFKVVSPANAEMVSFLSDKLDIVTSPSFSVDQDGDPLFKEIRIVGPKLDTLVNTSNSTPVFIKTDRLKPSSEYTITLVGTDGLEFSNAITSTFITPIVTKLSDEPAGIRASPNPFSNQLTIQAPGAFVVKIFNTLGQLVFEETGWDRKELSTSLSSGVYLITVETNTTKAFFRALNK